MLKTGHSILSQKVCLISSIKLSINFTSSLLKQTGLNETLPDIFRFSDSVQGRLTAKLNGLSRSKWMGMLRFQHVMSHPVVNHSAQKIDFLAYVRLSRTQEIAHGIIQTEHDRIICVSIQMSVQGFHGCQSGS
mgnify:CR=1 FL=1